MNIFFENCGQFITSASDEGKVVVRCDFYLTDCKDDENLGAFVVRHGGEVETSNSSRLRSDEPDVSGPLQERRWGTNADLCISGWKAIV